MERLTIAKATPRVVREKMSLNSTCALPHPRASMRVMVIFLIVYSSEHVL